MKIATRDAYGAFLAEDAKANKDVIVLDADLSKSTKTAEFEKVAPERFFNVGIAEQNLIGIAAGLAAEGKIPFASSFAIFAAGRGFEVIRNSVCYPKLNVKICATHAGLTVGPDGGSHQAIEDIAIMRSLPNMTVINPADAVSAKALLKSALEHQGPVYVRLGRAPVPICHSENTKFEIGKGIKLKEGKDIAIVATGIMVSRALEASAKLDELGIKSSVIDMHSLKPFDNALITNLAQTTGKIVTVEEHSVIGGLGSAVCEVVADTCPVPVRRMGVQDTFGESGSPDELLQHHGLTVEDIVKVCKDMVGTPSEIEFVENTN